MNNSRKPANDASHASPPEAKNPPIPVKQQLDQLQAEVLALKAAVLILLKYSPQAKTYFTRHSRKALNKLAETTPQPAERIEAAKKILVDLSTITIPDPPQP